MSQPDPETIRSLLTHGVKARATIVRIDPPEQPLPDQPGRRYFTFQFEPLSGGDSHIGTRELDPPPTVSAGIGDVWPAWFLADNPTVFMVGAPTGQAADLVRVYRDFGIPVPPAMLDAASSTSPEDRLKGRMQELRQARARGVITDDQMRALEARFRAEAKGEKGQ